MTDNKKNQATFWQTLSAVLWSFFGVRRSKDHTDDMSRLNPVHVIIVGILAAAMFVLGLLAVVKWVVSQSV
ncbi:MAG: DUF2970 domain-containing protein [Limnobacter sp.]|uniref:DUF2970 domain-containing protein n=1 Tax=Limnobacter sp. TaxID=2003368 RepID=UPI003919D170